MEHLGNEITFGQWLRRRRKSLDLTQEGLAEQIPCAKGTIRRLESDDLRPSKQLAERLADVLSVPPTHRLDFVSFARQGLSNGSLLDLGAEIRTLLPEKRDEQPFAPIPSPASRRYAIPAAPNPLIGRMHTTEIAVELLMHPDVRLVTLLGPPGVGKTRLAMQIATQIRPNFRNGACFVALASLAEAEHVLPAIAQAIDLLDSGRPLVDALRDRLQSEELLLVLDNFEHLITAASAIAALLVAAPSLKVLCTSRVPLHIGGEHEFVVPLLALPDLAHLPPLATLTTNPAVALFVARARSLLPDFVISTDNMQQIAAICHRLDGLPLAIELAATRIKLFAPATILARLDQRFSFLTGGTRDAPARQRTLTAAIAWSYELLDAVEKSCLNRLGIFWGGCTVEAVVAICSDHQMMSDVILRDATTIDVITALVNHSLVQATHDEEGQVRFSLLETIREFALHRLDEQGESAMIRARHAHFFLAFAKSARKGMQGAQQGEWVKRLNADSDNLRAAFDWSLATDGEIELGLEAGAALWRFWWTNGQMSEARHRLDQLLQRARNSGITKTRAYARALHGAANLAFFAGEPGIALAQFEEAQKLGTRLGDKLTQGATQVMATAITLYLSPDKVGNGSEGSGLLAQLDEGLEILRDAGIEALPELGHHHFARCLISFQIGDLDAAQQHADAAMKIFSRLAQPYGLGVAFNFQGDVARLRGDLAMAAARYQAGLPLLRQANARSEIPAVLHNLAHTLLGQGDLPQARALFIEGLALPGEVSNRSGIAECLIGLAAVAMAQHHVQHAATLLGAVEVLLERANITLFSIDQEIYRRTAESACAALDITQWEAAQMIGREMTLKQLIASEQLPQSD